ncbi:MAG: ribbon-helix-helix protein, CopG family [Rectinemataceae bacterium]|nr:ribbon-helix-helix protein, CopG family [Rectinemataceae bacterium]
MAVTKIAISIDKKLLERLDQLIQIIGVHSRSKAIQEAVKEKIERMERSRLARECAKLDQKFERAMADADIMRLDEWPEY